MQLILRYIKPFLSRMGVGMLIKLGGTVVELFIPYILAYLIDTVTPKGEISGVALWGGVMLFCSALAWVMNIWANRMAAAVARDTVRQLRHDLFEKIMHLTSRQVDSFTIPSLISRMTTDTYNIHRMVGMAQRMGVRAPILLLGGLIITVTLDPVMAGVLALMMPILGVMVYTVSRKSLPLFGDIQRAMDDLVRVVREGASGIRVIKALSKEPYERQRFSGVNAAVVKAETKANVTMGLSRPLMNTLLNLGQVAVIVVGAYRVMSGQAEVGAIVAFLSYFIIMLNAIMGLNRILLMYQNALASSARMEEVLYAKGELDVVDLPGKTSAYHLEARDICFSYSGKEDTLSHISFALRRGESLGIIGPTGAGKSTLAALLMRFYDVRTGTILLGGKDIRSMEMDALRSRFGVVFQNDAIFKDTLEGNIKVGRDIAMKAVEQAMETAQAAAYIEASGGLGYDIDAHGVNLSGGQRQRLLIARALAGSPDILILDDSSSALDYKTDAAMRQSLKANYDDATTIIVAQRISSIRHCDHILVLEEGRALGYGRHEELMESCTLYQEIYQIQMGE